MEAMQLMPVHRTNMLMQTFNQPKFEIETPVETIEAEIISSRRENKRLYFYWFSYSYFPSNLLFFNND